jgi:hypothetical protein
MAHDIEILRTETGFQLRPISPTAMLWVMKELRLQEWQFRDGWCHINQHVERTLDGIAAAGFVRKFIARIDPIMIGTRFEGR